uniref:Thioredoxin domain-containing protein n=1 Tax=Trichuris muris TaxID=70415 RepID=A0A5S6QI86_TRIMR
MSDLAPRRDTDKCGRLTRKAVTELKRICTVHHFLNALLCAAFYVSKVVPCLCHFVFGKETKCKISEHEYQILLLLAFVIYTKNRKATSWYHYFSNVILYTKLANFALFYWVGPVYALAYATLAIIISCVFPEPVFNGPEAVLYFRGSNPMQEISQQKDTVWLVEFYANWSSMCIHFAPIFANLSLKYALPNLKFGKLDVGRYPQEAQNFRVDNRLVTKALPTVILFRGGKEVKRLPFADSCGRVLAYHFTEENVIRDFDLNNVYLNCTRQLKGEICNEKRRPKSD